MDLDGDGRRDVLSGSWPGELYIFRGGAERTFGGPEKIKDSDGEELNVGKASAVLAWDWEGDGDLDLLVGDIRGFIHLILNEGGAKDPRFGAPRKLKASGRDISVIGGDSAPVVADWDGDGKPDLLTGTGDGSVVFFRNIGSRKEPVLEQGRTLVPASKGKGSGSGREERGSRSKICVTDWNEDGRLDLLLGDFSTSRAESGGSRYQGRVWLFLRKSSGKAGSE